MDRTTVELAALAFQTLLTFLLALVYYGLWRQRRRSFDATWSLAWAVYAVRLGAISAFIVTRAEIWLLAHQIATGVSALLLLYAALQFSRGAEWPRWRFAWLGAAVLVSSVILVYWIHDVMVGLITSAGIVSLVTLWTGFVFWRHRAEVHSAGATVLAVSFTLWGLHHLDYPFLRPLGTGVLFGVYADVLFIAITAIGALFLVLEHDRRAIASRSTQLEQLTRLLLTAQEDERRRIARELHDEAGQVLTAVKIDLDLAGQRALSEMVGQALAQVRDLSNLLRPTVLDDLGLLPAIRALVDDFAIRTRVRAEFRAPEDPGPMNPEQKVAIYRIVQEALTNVARHANAHRVVVVLHARDGHVDLSIEDDGRGPSQDDTPHLGLLGMRERVSALGGTLETGAAEGAGFRVAARIPAGARG
jgi:signal transduction histidine kinase